MKGLVSFVSSRVFWVNLAIALVVLFILGSVLMAYLSAYTHHGEQITVRPLVGRTLEEVDELLKTNRLTYLVNDTSYSSEYAAGAVLAQNPKAGSLVKENRTIYLTINDFEPPKVSLPDLKFKSIRVAAAVLKTKDLKIGNIEYRPSPDVMGKNQNYILEMVLNGDTLEVGSMIHKGSTIDLIVSSGMDGGETPTPVLIGLTLDQAIFVIGGYQLNIGAQIFEPGVELGDTYQDTLNAVIYKQIPAPETPYKVGAPVDIFLTKELPDSMKQYLESDSLLMQEPTDMPPMPEDN